MTYTNSAKTTSIFNKIRFIMVRPHHPGNVGATARAMKTMGFTALWLVGPLHKNVTQHEDAIALASGAQDVLQNAFIVDSLEEALATSTLAFGLTARPREIGPPVLDIRQAANFSENLIRSQPGAQLSVVLGTERYGLQNEELALCQRLCHIPANPHYSSLNVSQAAQLVAWELRYALATAANLPLLPSTDAKENPDLEPASTKEVQDFINHFEQALIAVDFLNPKQPGRMMRRLQHLFHRASLSHHETRTLRGICKAIIQAANKSSHSE